jgi:hypothetical protein
MTETPNAAAPHHMPWFMTAPGETDGLMVGMLIFLIVVIVLVGNLYFQLHALPERRAHRTNKAQMEVVAILALLALFTHQHIFWIAALLLAFVQLPDFSTPLNSISDSLETLVRGRRLALPEPDAEAALEGSPPEPEALAAPRLIEKDAAHA